MDFDRKSVFEFVILSICRDNWLERMKSVCAVMDRLLETLVTFQSLIQKISIGMVELLKCGHEIRKSISSRTEN